MSGERTERAFVWVLRLVPVADLARPAVTLGVGNVEADAVAAVPLVRAYAGFCEGLAGVTPLSSTAARGTIN